jgi:HlyD family secretion protein
MTDQQKKWLTRSIAALVVIGLGILAWQRYGPREEETGVASGNGRIEATEINIAPRIAGRVKEIRVREGEFVTAGQVIAQMDVDALEAQRQEAEAQKRQAESRIATARSQLAQRESEKASAQAMVAQRQVEFNAARRQLTRSASLAKEGFLSPNVLDDEQALVNSVEAALNAARAQVSAADAGIASARAEVTGTKSAMDAADANIERLQADINDAALRSPRDGRVQFLVARVGEVLGAGATVLNLIDLSDVYMTFFLPTTVAGRIGLGSEARIVLDAAPSYVIPAKISFVSDVAQFTPKTVETASEREKLMFRVRAQIPPDLLRKHITQVKTGLPGVTYVRIDQDQEWPERLQVKLPPS